jgi:hypothetical protein
VGFRVRVRARKNVKVKRDFKASRRAKKGGRI